MLFLNSEDGVSKALLIIITLLILITIPVTVILVKQRQELRQKAVEVGDGQLVCDSGPNPYDSNTIVVTNKTGGAVDNLRSNIFRCAYDPVNHRIREGFYTCEPPEVCAQKTADCQSGTWDPANSKIEHTIAAGASETFTVVVNPCEVVQIDTENSTVHPSEAPSECYNIRSAHTNPEPPNPWPGGIAFGIKANSTGYNPATNSCPTPTVTMTPTITPTTPITITATVTPTKTPTLPPGTPTKTGTPTATIKPTNTIIALAPSNTPRPTAPPGSTPTPTAVPPVSGNSLPTILTIIGGGAILLLGILL